MEVSSDGLQWMKLISVNIGIAHF